MPLCRTMYGVTGNVRVRLCEGTKVAAVSEGISGLCSILYTGASGNKCGLSLEQRRASFVGIKNRQNKGLQSCSIVQHHLPGGIMPYAPIGVWGGGTGNAGDDDACGVLAHRSIALRCAFCKCDVKGTY